MATEGKVRAVGGAGQHLKEMKTLLWNVSKEPGRAPLTARMGMAPTRNGAEAMVTCVEMPGEGVVEGRDGGGGVGGRVTSTCSPVALPSQDSSNNSNSSQQEHSHIRSTGFVKENGSFVPNQERISSSVSAVLPVSTPTPPPLKPAPSPFSNTFPSLGQMPSLVPGAPAPKSSPTLPAERGGREVFFQGILKQLPWCLQVLWPFHHLPKTTLQVWLSLLL